MWLWLVACGGWSAPSLSDSDGDGLLDEEEISLGLDPQSADSDDDGLRDDEELAIETDPHLPDTDGDRYSDRDELAEGRDPLDPASRIYGGGWPYHYFKDDIDRGPAEGFRIPFERVERWVLSDQHGEPYDLYDLHGDDAPIVLAVGPEWDDGLRALSSWITGGADPGGYRSVWRSGPEMVASGKVRWVTLLIEDEDGREADLAAVQRWANTFRANLIPVLTDPEMLSATYLTNSWPADPFLVLLTPDLRVEPVRGTIGDALSVIATLDERFTPTRRRATLASTDDPVVEDDGIRWRGRAARRRGQATGSFGEWVRRLGW